MARIAIQDLDPRTGRPIPVALNGYYCFTEKTLLKENAFNGGDTFLLAPTSGFAGLIEGDGLVLVDLLDGTRTLQQAASALAQRRGLGAREAATRLKERVSGLVSAGVIERREMPAHRPLRRIERRTTYSLENLEIVLTGRCNLRCVYCSRPTPRKHMPDDLLNQVVDRMDFLGVTGMLITGGEPMLHPRFWELITQVSSKGVQITVFTNGSMLGDKEVRDLADCAGLQVVLSIDTLDPRSYRGLGQEAMSPKRLLGLVGRLKEAAVPLRVNTVLVPGVNTSRAKIEEFLATLVRSGVEDFSFFNVLPIGRAKACRAEASVFEAAGFVGRRIGKTSVGGNDWTVPKRVSKIPRTLCGVGTLLTSVHPDGKVNPCVNMPHICAGSLRDQSLEEIWEHGEAMDLFRRRECIESPRCRDCPDWRTCSGGCRARAYYFCGSFTSPDPFNCAYFGQVRRARRLVGV